MVVFSLAVMFGCDQRSEKKALAVSDLVIREMPPTGDMAVAYLRIDNPTNTAHVVNYVHSDVADHIEVHRHIYDNGMMKMREVKHATIAAASSLVFKPSGYHLMLFGVHDRLVAGQEITVVFEFENVAPISVTGEVKRL